MTKSSAVQSWGPEATSDSWHAGGRPGDFGFKCEFCGDSMHRSCDCPKSLSKMLEKAVAGLVCHGRVCGEQVARSRMEEAMAGTIAKQRRWQGQPGSGQVASVQEQWQLARGKCGASGANVVHGGQGGRKKKGRGKGKGVDVYVVGGKGKDGGGKGAVVGEWKEWIDEEEKRKKAAVRRKERKKRKIEKIEEWRAQIVGEVDERIRSLESSLEDVRKECERLRETWSEREIVEERLERLEEHVRENETSEKERKICEIRLQRLEDVVKERMRDSESTAVKKEERGKTRMEEEKRRLAAEAQKAAEDAAAEAQRRKVQVEEEERRADAERERKGKVAEERQKREKIQADVATVQSGGKGGKSKGKSAECRQASDGEWYTDQEFWQFYGGSRQGQDLVAWDNARRW